MIVDLPPSDIPSAIGISDAVFGAGYIDDVQLSRYIAHTIVLGIYSDRLLAGFGIAFESGSEEARDILGAMQDALPQDHGQIAVIATIGIRPDLQSRGLGSRLFRELEVRAGVPGTLQIVVPAWASGNVCNLCPLLAQRGYSQIGRFPAYWKEECEQRRFRCISYTDRAGCVCSMILYSRKFC
jgi:N-acetylglutamate synthase-like GNAT family acetyltransferase